VSRAWFAALEFRTQIRFQPVGGASGDVIEKPGERGRSRTIWRVDNTHFIDSRKSHNGEKGHIAEYIVRLLHENVFMSGPADASRTFLIISRSVKERAARRETGSCVHNL
jgi:hypothetical protein